MNALTLGKPEVFETGLTENEPLRLAVFGQQTDPSRDRISRMVDRQPLAIQLDLAALRTIGTKDQPCRLRPSGPHESGQAQHLASAHRERDILHGATTAKIADDESLVADGGGLLGKLVVDRAADHHLDHPLARERLDRLGADVRAVAHHRDAIRDLKDLVQAVADVDDADALRLQLADDREQAVDFLQRQRGARFVHHDDPSILRQRLGDLDDLLLGDGQRAADRLGIERHAESLEELLRSLMFAASVVSNEACRLPGPEKCSREPSARGPD